MKTAFAVFSARQLRQSQPANKHSLSFASLEKAFAGFPASFADETLRVGRKRRWGIKFAMDTSQVTSSNDTPSNLFPFDAYLRGRGLTRVTGYRYRRKGLITAVNIYGRLYLTRSEIERFEQRVINGDFPPQNRNTDGQAS